MNPMLAMQIAHERQLEAQRFVAEQRRIRDHRIAVREARRAERGTERMARRSARVA